MHTLLVNQLIFNSGSSFDIVGHEPNVFNSSYSLSHMFLGQYLPSFFRIAWARLHLPAVLPARTDCSRSYYVCLFNTQFHFVTAVFLTPVLVRPRQSAFLLPPSSQHTCTRYSFFLIDWFISTRIWEVAKKRTVWGTPRANFRNTVLVRFCL